MVGPAPGSEAYAAQDKGMSIIAICWSITAVSSVFVVGRLYVRGRILGKFYWDDYFALLSQICCYISTALSTVAVAYGNGEHQDHLTLDQKQGVILWTTAGFCPGIMSFSLPKMAVTVLLTRLLKPSRAHKWFLWGMGILCQLALLSTVGVLLGRCNPPRSMWDFSVKGECFDKNILVAYCIATGVFSAFVDIYLGIYPATVLFKLQLPLKKLALGVALGAGALGGVVAIYKTTRIPTLSSPDFSYDSSDLVIWTVIEGSTLIIASSIPTLQPLVPLILQRTPFSSAKASKQTPRYYEDYSDPNKSVELGQRKPKAKPKDDLALTIVDDVENESQVKILATQEREVSVSTNRVSQPENGAIMRTDSITVSYEDQGHANEPGTSGSMRWRPV